MSDPHFVKCPSCLSNDYCRLVSAPSFKLKGSGWYATDFKSSSVVEGTSSPQGGDVVKKIDSDKQVNTAGAAEPTVASASSNSGSEG